MKWSCWNLTFTLIVENVSIGTTRIIITNSNARTVTVGKFGLQKKSFEKIKVRSTRIEYFKWPNRKILSKIHYSLFMTGQESKLHTKI
jgi:hypothetical protein